MVSGGRGGGEKKQKKERRGPSRARATTRSPRVIETRHDRDAQPRPSALLDIPPVGASIIPQISRGRFTSLRGFARDDGGGAPSRPSPRSRHPLSFLPRIVCGAFFPACPTLVAAVVVAPPNRGKSCTISLRFRREAKLTPDATLRMQPREEAARWRKVRKMEGGDRRRKIVASRLPRGARHCRSPFVKEVRVTRRSAPGRRGPEGKRTGSRILEYV